MELRSTREMRRNERLDKVMAKKAENSAAPARAQAQPAQKQAPADKVSLSRQALDWLEEQSQKMWEQNQSREQRQGGAYGALSALDSAGSELDLLSKAADVQDKCLKIAASIMKGDRVPPEDLEYLMKNDPEGYKLALALRREKEDPEDCESVLGNKEETGSAQESGGETASVQSPEPSGGDAALAAE